MNFSSIISPRIVVTAPDGNQLWIDPLAPSDSPAGPSLWPNGFKIGLQAGTMPANGKATDSPAAFLIQQAPTLLAAPGPLGLAWGLWLLGAVALGAAAVVAIRKL